MSRNVWTFAAALALAAGPPTRAAVQPSDTAPAAQLLPPTVLVIYPDNRLLPSIQLVDAAIRGTLGVERGRVSYFAEYVDPSRFPGEAHEREFVTYLQSRYRDQPPALVVAAGLPSLQLMIDHRRDLFPGVPVVYTAILARQLPPQGLDAGMVGVVTHVDETHALELALRLQPDAEEVVVVGGASDRDASLLEALRPTLQAAVPPHLRLRWLTGLTMDALKSAVAALPRRSIVIYGGIFRDAAGRTFVPAEALDELAPVSAAPLYGAYESFVGHGVVGGVMESWSDQGRAAAELALRILAGESPQALGANHPLPESTLIDWRQLKRFGLDAARLPPGARVLYREPTFWEQYWRQTLGAVAIGALQLVLIAVLAIALQRRRQAEGVRQQAEARAVELRDELAHASRVATMGELASTLAHELNQPLAAILSNAQAARRWMSQANPDLDEIRAIVDDIVADDKRAGEIIHRMRNLLQRGEHERTRLDLRSVVRDVAAMVQGECLASDVRLTLDLPSAPLMVEADQVQSQQVLLNVMKNAVDAMAEHRPPARRLIVSARPEGRQAVVTVRDTGPGIPPETRAKIFDPFFTTKAKGLGVGLAVCRRIAEAHGGALELGPSSSEGATFLFSLPLEDQA